MYCASTMGVAAAATPLPVARHVGRWNGLPTNCPTGGYDSLNNAPFLGNAGELPESFALRDLCCFVWRIGIQIM